MTYSLTITKSAAKAIKNLEKPIQQRIIVKIDALRNDPKPPGSLKLAASLDAWRIRVGDYRIIYEIQDTELVITVIRVAHRREAYRQ